MAHIGIKQIVRPEKEINLFPGFRLDYSKCAHRGIASHCGRKRKDLLTGSRLEKGGGGAASAASPCGAVARPASLPSGLRASVLPGRRAGQALEEVHPDVLELRAAQAEVEELCSVEIMF